MSELRSALIVAVPEAAETVDGWRERTCADRPSIGIPAHVTILFPFIPAAEIEDDLFADLRNLFSEFEPFVFALREPRRFPQILYLAPEPVDPFLMLTRSVVARYPDYPPYAGEIPLASIVPHLTVARGDATVLDQAEAEVRHALPIDASAREVLLIVEVEPDWARWTTRTALPLGLGGAS